MTQHTQQATAAVKADLRGSGLVSIGTGALIDMAKNALGTTAMPYEIVEVVTAVKAWLLDAGVTVK